MFNMVQVLLVLITAHALSMGEVVAEEITPPRAAELRSFGPYGRRKSTGTFTSSSEYDLSNGDLNQRRDNHRFVSSSDNNQQNLYSNHNLGNRNTNNQERYHNIQNLYSNYNVNNRNNFNEGYTGTNNRMTQQLGDSSSFNGFGFEVDQSTIKTSGGNVDRDTFNNVNNLNSNQLALLSRLYQADPDEFRRRVGSGELPDIDWTGIHRSSGGMLGGSGGRMSLDVYSFLALGMFTAFIAYVVYFFITMSAKEGGGAGRHDLGSSRKAQTMMSVIDDVTNAFDRWAILEYLPENLPELDILKLLKDS